MNLYCHHPQTEHSRSIPIPAAAWTGHLSLWRDRTWAREVWRKFLSSLSGFPFPSLSPSWSSLWAERQRALVDPHPLRLALVLAVGVGLPVVLILVGEAFVLHNEVVAVVAAAVQEDTEIDERRNVKIVAVEEQAAAKSGEVEVGIHEDATGRTKTARATELGRDEKASGPWDERERKDSRGHEERHDEEQASK